MPALYRVVQFLVDYAYDGGSLNMRSCKGISGYDVVIPQALYSDHT